MEKKARRHGETRRYNRRGGNTKGLIEIEIFDEGIIDKFLIQEGTKVPVGTVMALLQPSGVSLDTKKEKEAVPLQPRKTIKSTPASTAEIRKIKVSPLARRIAEENHIKLESVKGTGPDGAITKEDVDHVIAKQKN
jgi:pyruvate dehydrogenase E2 component (dihydrolipoamide acetyltransferase)